MISDFTFTLQLNLLADQNRYFVLQNLRNMTKYLQESLAKDFLIQFSKYYGPTFVFLYYHSTLKWSIFNFIWVIEKKKKRKRKKSFAIHLLSAKIAVWILVRFILYRAEITVSILVQYILDENILTSCSPVSHLKKISSVLFVLSAFEKWKKKKEKNPLLFICLEPKSLFGSLFDLFWMETFSPPVQRQEWESSDFFKTGWNYPPFRFSAPCPPFQADKNYQFCKFSLKKNIYWIYV